LSAGDALRPQTYATLISLLAATGLRISEALHLRYGDVTPDGLLIRKTKFQKTRLVPLHETAVAGLGRYLAQRRAVRLTTDHVFVNDDGMVRVLALDLEDLVRIADARLTRTLDDDECRQFLHRDSCAS